MTDGPYPLDNTYFLSMRNRTCRHMPEGTVEIRPLTINPVRREDYDRTPLLGLLVQDPHLGSFVVSLTEKSAREIGAILIKYAQPKVAQ
jgi:hypothetical protein